MANVYGTINRDASAHVENGQQRPQEKSSGKGFGFPKVYVAAISALLNIVNLGLVTSYTAPAGVRLEESTSITVTPDDVSWIASMGAISAIFGGLLSGFASQKLGRKAVLMYVSVPFLAGWLMIGNATSIDWIYAGRLLTGLCCGVVSVTVPTYVVEISTPNIRGMICTWFNVAFATGVLLDMSLGAMLTWEWLAVSGAVLTTAAVFQLAFMPESPYWLISKGQGALGMKAIEFLRGGCYDAAEEYRIIANEIEKENKVTISPKDVFKKPIFYRPIVLSIFLMFFQQFSGINALMSYTVEILKHAETTWDPSVATIIICSMQVISTMVCSVLMDRVGRRSMFILSGLFLAVGLTDLGLFSYLTRYRIISAEAFGWMPVVGFMIYLIAFSMGFGPVPWVMSPEMVPTQARSYVVAVATLCTNLFMFIVVKTYDRLRTTLDDYGIYFLYSIFCLTGCLFCFMFVPETRGKPLNEIQEFFKNQNVPDEKQKLLVHQENSSSKSLPSFKERGAPSSV